MDVKAERRHQAYYAISKIVMMKNPGFELARTPRLYFGVGAIEKLLPAIKSFGSRVVIVTGKSSSVNLPKWKSLQEQMLQDGISWEHIIVSGEPTPSIVDAAVTQVAALEPKVVVAIGGGSVLDAGKAISAMIPSNSPVKYYLEGIGNKQHDGSKIPFIAIPTTAGTGSEAAKNAVLSETGPEGFKRSLRHDNFIPEVAILDPELALTCPTSVTAASGMDAFTQLLESYVSKSANAITDALAFEGLRQVSQSLLPVFHDPANVQLRASMAQAAYLSGVTLTNAGLGLVHGFAGTIGGYYDIAHGVVCSTLMWSCNLITVRKLREEKNHHIALEKYAKVGRLFAANEQKSDDYYIDLLLETILATKTEMRIPTLRECGVPEKDLKKIIMKSDNKNNPVPLDYEQMLEALLKAWA